MFWDIFQDSKKYPKHMFLLSIECNILAICDFLLLLKRRFCDRQIVIITNFVVVWSVGIKNVVCTVTVTS